MIILNMVYGDGRRLRVIAWSIAMIASYSIQDTRIRNYWVREGCPEDARLVDVVLHKQRNPAHHAVCLVIEHDSFDPVPAGTQIPEQPVVFLDVQQAMLPFTSAPPGHFDEQS